MKKIIPLSLLLLFFLSPKAQTFEVSTGDTLKLEELQRKIPLGNGFLSLEPFPAKSEIRHLFIKKWLLKYGIDLFRRSASIMEKESSLSDGEKSYGPLLPKLLNFYGQPYLLYYQSVSEDADSKMQILLAKIDTATMQPEQPKELFLVEQNTLDIFNSDDFLNDHRLDIKASPDSSKILMLWSSATNRDFHIDVLDRHLDSLWTKEQQISPDAIRGLQSERVNNQGSVFFTYTMAGSKDSIPGSHIGICNPDGGFVDREITLQNGHPVGLFLLNAKDSNFIMITGTWSDKPAYLSGVYSARIDAAEGTLSQIRQTAFPDQLIKSLHQDRWAGIKPKNYGLDPIDLQAFLRKDGSIDLVGEFRMMEEPSHPNITVADVGNILYAHLPANPADTAIFGQLPNFRRIEENTVGYGYFAFPWNNGIVIFYNDNPANRQISLHAYPFSYTNYYDVNLVAVTFTNKGEVKKERLVSWNKDRYLALTENFRALSPSTFLVPLQKIEYPGELDEIYKWCRITGINNGQ